MSSSASGDSLHGAASLRQKKKTLIFYCMTKSLENHKNEVKLPPPSVPPLKRSMIMSTAFSVRNGVCCDLGSQRVLLRLHPFELPETKSQGPEPNSLKNFVLAIVTDIITKLILPEYSPAINRSTFSQELPTLFPREFQPAICVSVFSKCERGNGNELPTHSLGNLSR